MKHNTPIDGDKCQSTSNSALTEGEIFLYDGRGLVSQLDNIENCMVQKGKCITNISIVLWNSTDAINHCLYQRIKRLDATRYKNHFVIDELQASLIINEKKIQ
uniref:Uncharacterized protein n=1 Tax=Wuchereria bancrofti TaxID=6293 RepID=A0A1I8F0V3_WUCBA